MTALSFTQVEIDGFRGLRSLNLEGLGRVNILVGQNNCGKTSVLEALSILCNPENSATWLSMVWRRDFGRLDETIVQSLGWCFLQVPMVDYSTYKKSHIHRKCEFKCDGTFPLRELVTKFSDYKAIKTIESLFSDSVIDKSGNEVQSYETNTRLAKLENSCKWVLGEKTFDYFEMAESDTRPMPPWHYKEGKKIEYKVLTPYSHQLNKDLLKDLAENLFNDDIVELLQKFDADIEGVQTASFSGERPAIYIKHKKLGIAPLSIFGDATRRAVLLTSTLLSLKDGGVLLIDEVEVGIHVTALANVFSWLVKAARNLNVQVFVTTHSLEALDAITFSDDDRAEEDIVVFHLEQTDEKTESKRLSGDLLYRLRVKRGLDVR